MAKRRRKNSGDYYLKNENLLIYIHESKKSFCEYVDKCYSDFDVIIEREPITQEMIDYGKIARAERINDRLGNEKFHSGMTNKQVDQWLEENGHKPEDFSDDQVVFRRMIDDHIPNTVNKKQEVIKVKANFPPFQHVIIQDGEEKVVGWSHRKNGKFSFTHGKVNDRLGKAFLKLVERYGRKWNWRNYSWLEEMKGQALVRLSTVALQFNEAKSQNPFAWYTMVVERTFMHVLSSEKKQLEVKRKVIESDPTLELNITFGEQAQRDIDNYEKDNMGETEEQRTKRRNSYRTSGKSLSQIKAEKEKEELEKQKQESN